MTAPDSEEYQELIGIIENDPAKMISDYIRDWYFILHKNGTEGAFPPETTEEEKRENLKAFLLSKFPDETALIEEKIKNIADYTGYEEDRFYGGKRQRRKTKKNKKTKTKTNKDKKPRKGKKTRKNKQTKKSRKTKTR